MRYREIAYYDPDPDQIYDRDGTTDRSVVWFFGTIDQALQRLDQCGDTTSRLSEFWAVRFDDRSTKEGFLQIWSDARRIDDRFWVVEVEDVIALEWLRERGGVELVECVEIRFHSIAQRDAFIFAAEASAVLVRWVGCLDSFGVTIVSPRPHRRSHFLGASRSPAP
ncbi:hypothetical protein M2323_004536 [Rhodoblastus acidophilus]|uniref:hypothetical protein n=1 Tax=Rhodoblastus acidophilus TaxID=1074 RepID=UPI002224E1CB|nr:hypothetical protein [Rhodoblastus acidophilus]MCW2286766.1 hypothetical protein [Rhodoblastus acidophilus]MCW2335586.1 hypothetical protein [Rhodoblastus acidophilus]